MRLIRLLKNDLAKETALWVEKDLISEPQAVNICKEYGADYYAHEQNSFLLNLLTIIGFVFIGIALIVLIGHNWDEIPRAIRMIGLLGVTACTQLFAWRRYSSTGEIGLFLLGNLFYGASIILIAQIYHLGEHMPDGVFWWALGSLPFALITRSSALMLFTLTLGIIWCVIEASSGFIPMAFPVFVCSAIWVLWRGNISLILLLTTLFSAGLCVDYSFTLLLEYLSASENNALAYGVFFYEPLQHFSEELTIAISLVVLYYSFALYIENSRSVKAQDYSVLIRLWVLRFSLVLLIIYSFEESWREFISHNWNGLFPMLIYVVVILSISCWLAYKAKALKAVAAVCVTLLAPFIFWLITNALISEEAEINWLFIIPLVAQVLTNITTVIVAVTLIIRGISNGVRAYFFLGILTLIIIAYSRYFDMIGSYIGAAVLFLVFALILLGAAQYWKKVIAKQSTSLNKAGGLANE